MNRVRRTRVQVEGIVRGVGFRPFVHSLATRLGLAEAEGAHEAVTDFLVLLRGQAPPLAVVENITARDVEGRGETCFRIIGSTGTGIRGVLVSSDSATCDDCLREMLDPADRRCGYPFVNCTHCGPRFTIVQDVPCDRPSTTMAGFALCARCSAEHEDPDDRRFHAQPVCCPECGPQLSLLDAAGRWLPGDPVERSAASLAAGKVLAVKGLGGYHLAVDATDQEAATALRTRKHREDKPFAVMVPQPRQRAGTVRSGQNSRGAAAVAAPPHRPARRPGR